MGNNHPVQNNFGAWFGGPLVGQVKRTFFFVNYNYEGLRLSEADAQILTVPTPAEITGDFRMSHVTRVNFFSSASEHRPAHLRSDCTAVVQALPLTHAG
jgi:hypothetical protein